MKPVISKSLQDTVKQTPSLTEVHFDKNGKHYFNVHSLSKNKDDKEPKKLYGKGLESHRQAIPGVFNINPVVNELISKGDPETEIVITLTREEILDAKVKPEGDSLIAKVANMDQSELEALKALLNSAPAATATAHSEDEEI